MEQSVNDDGIDQWRIFHQNLARAGGVVEPVKLILSHSLIIMQNVIAVCHTAWEHIAYKAPKIGGYYPISFA